MTDDAQSLAERRGTSVHATEALLCNLREQKIKHTGRAQAAGATRRRMRISAPPAAGSGPRAASGPEELRDSERSHGYQLDAVAVWFQSLPQVTVDDSQRSILN
jgi:hypothetical protein